MNGSTETAADEGSVVGVCLTSESASQDWSCDLALGVVVCQVASLTLEDLRSRICAQIPTLPSSFIFVTEQGWPVAISQESSISSQKVLTGSGSIRIRRQHDRLRIGVKFSDGCALGFVFCDLQETLSVLRYHISQQLGRVEGSSSLSYQFVDRNGWPVLTDQELFLCVLDILQAGSVTICTEVFVSSSQQLTTAAVGRNKDQIPRIPKQLTFKSSKDELRSSCEKDKCEVWKKQLLISYVRAEAAQHALDLKKELTQLGFSVFLDVDEIKSGTDWQDALNYAVSNCEVFIPLVTPRYGQTQWTNREVKLADVLNKFILPISFVEKWPPRCLGIQFATTQFIAWKTNEEIDREMTQNGYSLDRCEDIRIWDKNVILRVCEEIKDQIETYCEKLHSISLTNSSSVSLPFTPSVHRTSTTVSMESLDQNQLSQSPKLPKPSLVICLHVNQRHFGKEMTEMFRANNFQVWCTTELLKDQMSLTLEESMQSVVSVSGEDLDDTVELDGTTDRDRYSRFQLEVEKASLVIIVLSKAFAESRISKQQVFYCEHRKAVIAVAYEDFSMPCWMSMLIGTSVLENVNQEGFMTSLLGRVKQLMHCKLQNTLSQVTEAKLCCATKCLRRTLPKENCVYISGGTSFYNKASKDICIAIGRNLAEVKGVCLVTGGFYGAGDVTAQSFLSRRMELGEEVALWHVLPVKDDMDFSHKAGQNKDRTFKTAPYGKTAFSGDSVRERETIVSRVIDICILIEGGPGAAHEAEQFIWNDHCVIPVSCTGGAAGGLFNVPEKMNDIPPGVASEDWQVLSDRKASPGEIGRAVASIVTSVQERIEQLNKSCEDSSSLSRAPTLSPPSFSTSSERMERKRKSDSKSPQSKRVKLMPSRTYILHNKGNF